MCTTDRILVSSDLSASSGCYGSLAFQKYLAIGQEIGQLRDEVIQLRNIALSTINQSGKEMKMIGTRLQRYKDALEEKRGRSDGIRPVNLLCCCIVNNNEIPMNGVQVIRKATGVRFTSDSDKKILTLHDERVSV